MRSPPSVQRVALPRTASALRSAVRGFTVVELIATLTVAALVAITAMPALARIDILRGSAAAARIAEDLRAARCRAMGSGINCYLLFSTTNKRWSVVRQNGGTGSGSTIAVTDPTTGKPMSDSTNLSSSLTLTLPSGSDLGFDFKGRPIIADGSLLTVDAIINPGGGRQVRVTGRTGAVALEAAP